MTHRSRSGGPGKRKPGQKKRGPKLHHPPSRTATETPAAPAPESDSDSEAVAEGAAVLPASVFLESPSDLDMLNALRSALHACVHSVDFTANVQKVKALLYDRKWLELFTDAELLDAYAGRWVPSRTLCFRELMAEIRDVRALFGEGGGEESDEEDGEEGDEENVDESEGDMEATKRDDNSGSAPAPSKHILSIGGGAGSEMLAIAAMSASVPGTHIKWTGVDIGNWSSILDRLETAVRDKWKMNASFEFIEADVLVADKRVPPTTPGAGAAPGAGAESESARAAAIAPAPPAFLAPLPPLDLTTIFFTLTELLAQNRARTVSMLRGITAKSPPGSLLLVADSASDIAEFPLGKDGRTWPVYMVLDALVLQALGKGQWEKVRSTDSKWFRLDEDTVADARWPCKLENARYWMRMYRRL